MSCSKMAGYWPWFHFLVLTLSLPLLAEDSPVAGERLLSHTRQLTFDGRRSGEGYFSRDGRQLVFQSERESGNPFFQIYWMNLDSGDTERISPGIGKTTCAWIHPDGSRILLASTHHDPEAAAKQKAELELRASGRQRRYAWDYDAEFELYAFHRDTQRMERLTDVRGYDAEGSYSPDGKWIAFASNRSAFQKPMSDALQKQFETDPSLMIDIYLMPAEGGPARRLTESLGYDGGPFFSPDGSRIVWRRFAENGATAEIMTMNVDGSDVRQLTRLGAMSWAPFYHPSGRYVVFTTNRHGFGNFELYLVDVDGKSQPVRVTTTDGFDGLPVFTPDGHQLAWTSSRTSSKQSQLFLADWDHAQALQCLGLDTRESGRQADSVAMPSADSGQDRCTPNVAASEARRQARADYAAADLLRHVDYLCRDELAGRGTGTEGERMATAYVAAYLDSLGIAPAGDEGTWFQDFDFTAGVALGTDNHLSWEDRIYDLDQDWRPLAFSGLGSVEKTSVAFAGYGITAPEDDEAAEDHGGEYDSYAHLDVKDKWVLILRYVPEDVSPERRQHLSRYASLRFKLMVARDHGARGLIVVTGPTAKAREPLVPLRFDGSLAGSSLPVISVTDEIAQQWLGTADKQLSQLQRDLDGGKPVMGFALEQVLLSAAIDIERVRRHGRNVLGRLQGGPQPTDQVVVVGAHVDHLGKGANSSSLARDDERDGIHYGADDNASGVAAMLEIAEDLAHQVGKGHWQPHRDVLFAAWSGEEIGLIGSSHFAQVWLQASDDPKQPVTAHTTATLYPAVSACLNLDMVGRMEKRLILQGIGSSSVWRSEIERRNVPVGLPITLQNDSYLPTDASVFFMHGVPILSAFTGAHSDYHTPRDTPEKLNYEATAKIARLMGMITQAVASRTVPPDFVPQTEPSARRGTARMRAYLGTIPDYAESDLQGVKLSGVSGGGPAAKAGVRGGDVIVQLAGKRIENIYDYTYAIEALKIGEPVELVVQRDGQRVSLTVKPASRE